MLSVWLPMATTDTADAFQARVADWPAARNVHVWDAEKQVSDAFAKRLGVLPPAWDLFMAWGRGVRWPEAAPPMPTVWMHQLRPDTGAPPALRFDPAKYEAEVARLAAEPAPTGSAKP